VSLQKDLREFIELLSSRGVECIVVGGHAVAFHGHPRFTGDIDFLIRPTIDNARLVMEALQAFGFSHLSLTAEDLTQRDVVVQLGRPPNRIDLMTSISGVGFDEAWSGKERGELDGLPVFLLGREALLKNKEAAGRDKDLADLSRLRVISRLRHET